MTLLYLVRPGDSNEPLRYSLRSVAAHVPHERVIVAGHLPQWVTGVEHIPVHQARSGRTNQTRILREVSRRRDVDKFVLMNDDFFAVAPVAGVMPLHAGPLARQRRRGWYGESARITLRLLHQQGVQCPLSFDRLHQPMPMVRSALAAALARTSRHDIQHRTWYGNLVEVDALPGADVKIRSARDPVDRSPWCSTSLTAWSGAAGRQLRAMFPDPCRYERS